MPAKKGEGGGVFTEVNSQMLLRNSKTFGQWVNAPWLITH